MVFFFGSTLVDSLIFFSSFQQFKNVHFVPSSEYSNTFHAVEASDIAFLPPSTRTGRTMCHRAFVCVTRVLAKRLFSAVKKKKEKNRSLTPNYVDPKWVHAFMWRCLQCNYFAMYMHSRKWWAAQANTHTQSLMFFEWICFRVRMRSLIVKYISLACPFSSTTKQKARRWPPHWIACRVWETHSIN